jgi:hypothetical protein
LFEHETGGDPGPDGAGPRGIPAEK